MGMGVDKGWLMAVDLSAPQGMVVLDGPGTVLKREIESGSRASRLFAAAGEMMSEAGIGPGDLSLVGAGKGPGSFTGIRIAVTAAKFTAAVLDIPLVAPDSLMVVAAGVDNRRRAVFAALDARRGEVYFALYRFEEGYPAVLISPGVAPPMEAASLLTRRMKEDGLEVTGAGSGIDAYPDAWPDTMNRVGAELQEAEGFACLCRLACARGEIVDPVALLPFYLRRPDVRGRSDGAGEGKAC
jgi:tRNA threonylcarbamoyladenosine biosynthesis protein TsaB